MAQIVSETVTVKFSKIVKDADASAQTTIVNKEVLDALAMMAEGAVGETVVVEVSSTEPSA